jgi:hypothetical protein
MQLVASHQLGAHLDRLCQPPEGGLAHSLFAIVSPILGDAGDRLPGE